MPSACPCCSDAPHPDGVSRRRFIANGTAALALGGRAGTALAQAAPRRIDVHHHVTPPVWLAALEAAGRGEGLMKSWSVQKSIEDMDRGGVATAMVSPTTPQVTPFGKDAAARIARESNEWAKQLASDHKGRFGTWAMLPLPHTDEALREITFAFDMLKVDGIGMMTSYGDKWLGDPHFAPVWEELNRRKATVYTHPTSANCCVNLVPGIPDYMIEFGADTTRSIASLILSGTTQKYPDINWIWSHGGGALTAFAERFLVQILGAPPYKGKLAREGVQRELNRFFYDTAQISGVVTLEALSKLVPVTQIVYGTDFPYRGAVDHTKGVTSFFKGDDLAKVERENALRLVPRLKA